MIMFLILLQSHRCQRPSRHHSDPKEGYKHKWVSFSTTMVCLIAQYHSWLINCCLQGPPPPTSIPPSLQSTVVQRPVSHHHSSLQALSGNMLSINLHVFWMDHVHYQIYGYTNVVGILYMWQSCVEIILIASPRLKHCMNELSLRSSQSTWAPPLMEVQQYDASNVPMQLKYATQWSFDFYAGLPHMVI